MRTRPRGGAGFQVCSVGARACVPGSSPAALAAVLLVLAQGNRRLGWCDHPGRRRPWLLGVFSVVDGPGREQGDRILSCPGEYRQQVVFVETTEKSFPSQTHLMCMLLPQQIECNVPHRSDICRGMVLPNAAAIVVEGHIS